ncbi:MAG: hypothetical protein GVY17_03890 [Cyanobacteria bacterium]|nr:hypothetical protein [Cyanobacteria bacterium GSL.Bin21]
MPAVSSTRRDRPSRLDSPRRTNQCQWQTQLIAAQDLGLSVHLSEFV